MFSLVIIIPYSPKILEDILDYGLMMRSRVGLEAIYYTYSTIFVRFGRKYSIHETSYGQNVRKLSHVFNLLKSLRRLVF